MKPGMKLSRVVILGAGGFIGKSLCERLQHERIDYLGLSSKDINLLDTASSTKLAEQLRPSDSLVFASAITPDKGRDRAAFVKNITMAQNVAAALEVRAPQHVIYISSDAVYPDGVGLIDENTRADSNSLYGLAHLVRERMLIEACGNTPLLRFRPSAVYGPGDTHNSYGPNRFIRSAKTEGKIVLFGNGEEQRDHVFIKDLVNLVLLALKSCSTGVINCATGSAVAFGEVAAKIKTTLTEVEIEPRPRQSPITHRHFDVSAINRLFPGFTFAKLEQGLKESIAEGL